MSKRSNSNRDGVVMVGEVQGKTVQVLQVDAMDPILYEWRVIHQDAKVYHPHNLYDTMDEAFEAAIKYLIPDAVQVDLTEPSLEDYAALDAMLFGMGEGEPIASVGEAIGMHNFLIQALQAMLAAQEQLPRDYDQLMKSVTAFTGPMSWETTTLGKLKDLQEQSLLTNIELARRDLETLSIFIARFVHL